MKHLFVPYEIALQLKEKGFGLSDDDYLKWFAFYENGILNNAGIPEADIGRKHNPSPNHLGADTINDFEAFVIMIDNSLDGICIAPLYQQVISWLYEKGIKCEYSPAFTKEHQDNLIVEAINKI